MGADPEAPLAVPGPNAPLELQLGPVGTVFQAVQFLSSEAAAALSALWLDFHKPRRGAGCNFSGEGFAVAHVAILARWRGTLPQCRQSRPTPERLHDLQYLVVSRRRQGAAIRGGPTLASRDEAGPG
jgi:hypothetical protein